MVEHAIYLLSKYTSKDAFDMEFSPDVGNNPLNPQIRRIKLCVQLRNDTGKSIEHMKL